MIAQLENTIINLDIEGAVATTITLQKSQQVTRENIFQAIARALDVVGKKYEQKEYFLTELVMAGEVVKEILILIESPDETPISDRLTKVVLASVHGDLHDIGKNIFAMLLQAQGFHVIDLGIDVPPFEIVSAVKKEHPKILGLSALLTTTVPEFEAIVTALEAEGIRDSVKIIVGGAAVNQSTVDQYRVDGWGQTVIDGIKLCKQWSQKEESE
ncbi:MAG: cobalamin-dependent protein [Candidatus Bathyarchaeota archaeon]|jgi:methylmalonyl-CoA mutase cobalamin-binding domain/chain|nr:cobalamin-dependent protein [Candidatus Bathyarchaeota archaeon]